MSEFTHISVLLPESVEILHPATGETVVDVTLGLGGHMSQFAEKVGSTGLCIGIDADNDNIDLAKQKLAFQACKIQYIHSNFHELPELPLPPVDVLFADLGMSSVHIDDPSRGFTYQKDVPLDLRYNRESGLSAAQYIRSVSEQDLADTLYMYGELRQSRKIAAVFTADPPLLTTDIAKLLEKHFGYRGRDLLPQIFQALRIAVNRELDALKVLLEHGPDMLRPGGRMAIITFHSLEDRLVKRAFKKYTTPEIDQTTGQTSKEAPYTLLTKKPITPSEQEIQINPRARSAKLRAIQKRLY